MEKKLGNLQKHVKSSSSSNQGSYTRDLESPMIDRNNRKQDENVTSDHPTSAQKNSKSQKILRMDSLKFS